MVFMPINAVFHDYFHYPVGISSNLLTLTTLTVARLPPYNRIGYTAMSCLNTLKAKGLRLTPQRRLIIELIHDKPAHLTAEEVISYVQERMPGVNKSTVYRTLELLEKAGCVYKSEMDSHTVFHHADEGHHHHLICEKCGKTVECDEATVAPFEKALRRKYGFEAHLQHLVISGLCDECRAAQSDK